MQILARVMKARSKAERKASKQGHTKTLTWRPNEVDWHLLGEIHRKLGVKPTEILRMALHRLAEHEGIRL